MKNSLESITTQRQVEKRPPGYNLITTGISFAIALAVSQCTFNPTSLEDRQCVSDEACPDEFSCRAGFCQKCNSSGLRDPNNDDCYRLEACTNDQNNIVAGQEEGTCSGSNDQCLAGFCRDCTPGLNTDWCADTPQMDAGMDVEDVTPDTPEEDVIEDITPDTPEEDVIEDITPDTPEEDVIEDVTPDTPEEDVIEDITPDTPEEDVIEDITPDTPEEDVIEDVTPDTPEEDVIETDPRCDQSCTYTASIDDLNGLHTGCETEGIFVCDDLGQNPVCQPTEPLSLDSFSLGTTIDTIIRNTPTTFEISSNELPVSFICVDFANFQNQMEDDCSTETDVAPTISQLYVALEQNQEVIRISYLIESSDCGKFRTFVDTISTDFVVLNGNKSPLVGNRRIYPPDLYSLNVRSLSTIGVRTNSYGLSLNVRTP